ncbi:hypothetical protein CY34DRAFT_18904 [Suillus luteus UH-Slu-Lm8-n1]|uniref:Uncharacterized protein n=1 Tax=Suillus luteus UH-Slu-Lm8-n1 TaxID=930992 RepID=A0A0C9Z5E0_9AGAM|nr:hypothetical protein CY34DRAFT_18904 [Suillus luteus UH-Slu-Lm8-n1]
MGGGVCNSYNTTEEKNNHSTDLRSANDERRTHKYEQPPPKSDLSPPKTNTEDPTPTSTPTQAIVSAGAMGSAVAKRLVHGGCTIYTNLDGRSPTANQRALDVGMINVHLLTLLCRKARRIRRRGEADIFKGFAKVFERVAGSLEGDRKDVETLKTGVEKALELQGMSK